MTPPPQLDHLNLALSLAGALALGPALLVGCQAERTPSATADAGPACDTRAFRLSALHVPTAADVMAGTPVGHDVDGVDGACGFADYEGSVDNAFLELAAAFPSLSPGLPSVQESIDAGLFCGAHEAECQGVAFELRLTTCGDAHTLRVFEVGPDAETEIGVAQTTTLSSGGALRAEFGQLELNVPYAFPNAQLRLPLFLEPAILGGELTEDGVGDIVLGGVLSRARLAASPSMLTAPSDGTDPLEGLFDVESASEPGVCDGFSVGLRAAAAVLTSPAAGAQAAGRSAR